MATVKEKDLTQVASLADADFIRAVSSTGESEIINYQTIRQRIVSEVLEEISSVLPSIETPTPSITMTKGTNAGSALSVYGKVALLRISLSNVSGAASDNIAAGTLTNYKPKTAFNIIGYYGNHPLIGSVATNGSFTVRNASTEAVSISGTSSAALSGAYILAE